MRPQDFSDLFRDSKKQVREAKKADLLASTTTQKSESEDTASIITLKKPTLTDWKSSKGSTLSAKLIRIEHEKTYIFKTSSGKILNVERDQLDPSSIKKANQLIAKQN
ncbi:hypothetical protein [Rubritalea sp.]|uniref:hypothetical protein n=1 Tax=Rubritalea sp. TaxID=2109375 RepID=UPI003EF1833B